MSSASDERTTGRRRRRPAARQKRAESAERVASRERLVLWQYAAPTTASEAEAAAWGKAVATRLEVAGAEPIARVSASNAASFDPLELDDAVDLALGLLADAAREAPGLEVTCALALGELMQDDSSGTRVESGLAIDRALLLAAAASPGELALDDAAHARAQDSLLFLRELRAGAISGHVLDARVPRKRDCRAALASLQRAPDPRGESNFERLRQLVQAGDAQRIVVRSAHSYAALHWMACLAGELQPKLVLHLGRRAAGLQPLGGLALALARADAALSQFVEPLAQPGVGEPLARLRAGAAVARSEAVHALSALLAAAERPVIVLDRAREIDAPSLAVTLEVVAGLGRPALLFILTDAQGLPPALARLAPSAEFIVEPLLLQERVRTAEQVLGPATSVDVATRVASLGGDTVLGIAEAARTLVCAGDLLFTEGAFRFRTEPRVASQPIPVDALLTERAAGLEPAARRVLEALCIAPQAADRSAIERIAALDGLSPEATAQGMAQLAHEGWLPAGPLAPMEHVIRSAVRNSMPPARAAELHRFATDALLAQASEPAQHGFGRALLAHHFAEGGRELEAAQALLDAAKAAAESGFPRMAVRLAALSLKLDGSDATRERARAIAHAMEAAAPPPAAARMSQPQAAFAPAPQAEARDDRHLVNAAARAATRAIARGDTEAAETLIDTAVADGFARAAAQRLWALAQLRKGDVPGAVHALKQAKAGANGAPARIRDALTAALILLESREPIDGVRAALEGLAAARRAGDSEGERAALHVLSGCYRMLGREGDAQRLEAAADGPTKVVEAPRL